MSKRLDTIEAYNYLTQKVSKEIQRCIENQYSSPSSSSAKEKYTEEDKCNAIKTFFFEGESTKWLYTTFGTIKDDREIDCPKIVNLSWSQRIPMVNNPIEIRNLIFQIYDNINYDLVNNKISTTFFLKGESSFWLFLHCNNNFDDKTIVILICKEEEFTENVSVSIGTFINKSNNNKNELYFFQKQQLIKNYKVSDRLYNPDDICKVKLIVYDEGKANVKIKAVLDDGEAKNELNGNFCMPVAFSQKKNERTKTYKFMIAGSGQLCQIQTFISQLIDKTKNLENDNDEDKKKDDCLIF